MSTILHMPVVEMLACSFNGSDHVSCTWKNTELLHSINLFL